MSADRCHRPCPGVEIVTWTTRNGQRDRVLIVDGARAPRDWLGRADIVLGDRRSSVREAWRQAARTLAGLPGCTVTAVTARASECVVLFRNRTGFLAIDHASASRDRITSARGHALRCYLSLCGGVGLPRPDEEISAR